MSADRVGVPQRQHPLDVAGQAGRVAMAVHLAVNPGPGHPPAESGNPQAFEFARPGEQRAELEWPLGGDCEDLTHGQTPALHDAAW
jgi:hypothetical protein